MPKTTVSAESSRNGKIGTIAAAADPDCALGDGVEGVEGVVVRLEL